MAAPARRGFWTAALVVSALGFGCTPGPIDVATLSSGGLTSGLVGHWTFDEGAGAIAGAGKVLVRAEDGSETTLDVGDLRMDLLSRKAVRGERVITLQPREFKLLEYLMRHAGQVVTRTMLLENVWDYHFDPQTNVVDVHISKLRQKIDCDYERPLLRTVRNAGYMLSANTDNPG